MTQRRKTLDNSKIGPEFRAKDAFMKIERRCPQNIPNSLIALISPP